MIQYCHISISQAILYFKMFVAQNMEMNRGLPDVTLMKLKGKQTESNGVE